MLALGNVVVDAVARESSVAELIVGYLEAEGIDTVFGVPGGPIMGLFAALARGRRVQVVLCKSEQGAVFAADGYARCGGRIGVAIVTSGPGATNALTGLAAAHADRVPLLLISGQVATSVFGRGAAQDSSALGCDVVAAAKPFTASSFMVNSAAHAAWAFPDALRTAWCKRMPVHVSVPADVLAAEVPVDDTVRAVYRLAGFATADMHAVVRAAEALGRARRPALLVGSGARGTGSQVVELAELLGAAVATTPKAKGVFPEDHELAVKVFGFAGSPQAEHALLNSDVDALLVLGSSLGELASHGWTKRLRPAVLIQVDSEPSKICANYAALGVVGDATVVVTELLRILRSAGFEARDRTWLAELKRNVPVTQPTAAEPSGCGMAPEDAFEVIQECLPGDARVLCDIGNSMAYALHYLTLRPPQQFLLPLGLAAMGHAVGAAVGSRFASDRPTLCIVGDAAFAMTGFETHTAAEYAPVSAHHGGPVFLVMNNGGNGMVLAGGRAEFGEHSGIDFGMYRTPFDIAQIARGFGVAAATAQHPEQLRVALLAALRPACPVTVIDVRIDSTATPPLGARIKTLIQYRDCPARGA